MKLWPALIIVFALQTVACKRDGRCDCVPPPQQETSWKITKVYGGFAPAERPLTDDQKNSVLTIKPNGTYVCTNTVTGQVTTGTRTITYNSSNSLVYYVYSPQLSIYPCTSFILIDNGNTSQVLSDGNPDGYQVTFTRQ